MVTRRFIVSKLEITVDGKTKQSIISEFAGRIAVEGGYFSHVKYVGVASQDLMCDIMEVVREYIETTFDTDSVSVKYLY